MIIYYAQVATRFLLALHGPIAQNLAVTGGGFTHTLITMLKRRAADFFRANFDEHVKMS